jgi:hypothetical protein
MDRSTAERGIQVGDELASRTLMPLVALQGPWRRARYFGVSFNKRVSSVRT